METVENPKAWSHIENRVTSVVVGVGMSLTYALLVLLSETLHLARRSKYFIADLDEAWWHPIVAYIAFGVASGALVGAVVRGRVQQSFLLGGLYFLLISLKVLGLDSGLLGYPKILALFGAFGIAFFGIALVLASRLRLGPIFPLLIVTAYGYVLLAIASGWAMFGGRLVAFLFSSRTVMIVVGATVLTPALTFVQHTLERLPLRGARFATPGALIATLLVMIIATSSRIPVIDDGVTATARAGLPDVYVLSFDAMRSDDLAAYIKSNPQGNMARLSAQAATFENVVSHGSSTDMILSNHTMGASTRCEDSLPRALSRAGYFNAMLYAGVGRRFAGSRCYDYYFAGDGDALVARFALPALLNAGDESLRSRNLGASELLQKLGRVAQNPAPIYAYLHFLELHAPYLPQAKRGDASYIDALKRYMQDCYVSGCDRVTNRALIERVRAAYLETFDEVDRAVGRARAIAESRHRPFLIILTADHGELFGEHGGFAHSGGLVPELLDIPYVVFDSRVPEPTKRCELLLSSEAVRTTSMSGAKATRYPDRATLEWDMNPLGRGRIDKQQKTLEYTISPKVYEHAGTWRNIHRDVHGTLPYPIVTCP